MTVFIVEDQTSFLEQLRALVAEVPVARVIGSAATASEAITAIEVAKPHVVLVDLLLSVGSGFEILRTVRLRLPDTKLLVVTSFSTPGIRKACLMGGADQFFDKLLELDALRQKLEQLSASLH